MSTSQVQSDFEDNHGRKISRDYIQQISSAIGKQIELGELKWDYHLPKEVLSQTKMVSIGRDGTTTYIRKEGYREVMSGTISFHNEKGERLHTIYKAQAPEYGKATFDKRFASQIDEVQKQLNEQKASRDNINNSLNSLVYIGLADGAKDNWIFLEQHTDVSILDYWHACEYLTLASKAASKSTYEQKQWLINARKQLKEMQDAPQELLREMKNFKRKHGHSKIVKDGLQKAITYFQNHQHQMAYAGYEKENYPIGSGVTEAACKVIVKQRLSRSGMKWNIHTAQHVLNIRALVYSDGQWQQFWENIDNYGFSHN